MIRISKILICCVFLTSLFISGCSGKVTLAIPSSDLPQGTSSSGSSDSSNSQAQKGTISLQMKGI